VARNGKEEIDEE